MIKELTRYIEKKKKQCQKEFAERNIRRTNRLFRTTMPQLSH